MPHWSKVHSLSDFAAAPKEEGIYFVGIYSGSDPLPAQPPPIADKFLGDNWPEGFIGKYVGRAWHTTLYTRLKDHFEKSSCKAIRQHLRQHGDHSLAYLYATKESAGFSGPDLRVAEHMFLTMAPPEWNTRKSEWADFRKGMKEFIDGLPDVHPLPSNLDCPVCGSLGPWSGVRCLSCGQISDPWG